MKRDAFAQTGLSDEIDELLTGYVLNHLSAQDSARVQALVKQHPELQKELDRLEEILGLMAHNVPSIKAPSTLKSRILAAAQDAPAATKPLSASLSKKTAWRKGAITASVLIAVGLLLGLDNIRLRTQVARLESEVNTLATSEHQIFALKGTAASPAASGNVVLDLENARAAITLQHLPVLHPGNHYQLWAQTVDKTVACGAFKPDIMGRVTINIGVPIHEYTSQASRLFITEESSSYTKQPSRKILMDSIS